MHDRWTSGVPQDALAAALVIALLFGGIALGSKAAGHSDSYGYLSQAARWRDGRLSVPQPWAKDVPWPLPLHTFAPLGYVPAQAPLEIAGYRPPHDPWSIVPAYSPGLPMLMAAATAIGGVCGAFWVVPFGGSLLALATYLIGRRWGIRDAGLLASLLLVASPPFLLNHMTSMSDVPVAGALTVAWWCVLGSTMRSAVGAAALLAVSILIRPNMVVVVPVFALYLALRTHRASQNRRRQVWRSLVILGGAAVVIAVFGAFVAAIVVPFLAYLVFEDSSSLRFLLPAYPFIMLGLGSAALSLAKRFGRLGPPVAAAALLSVAAITVRTADREWYVFDQRSAESTFIDVADYVREATPEQSVMLAMLHSGNLRYFGGRMTLRWDVLDPEWLDRAVAWMSERGVRTYALVSERERLTRVERFASQTVAATLRRPPVFRYGDLNLFDLTASPETRTTTREIPVLDREARCVPPAQPPQLVWNIRR